MRRKTLFLVVVVFVIISGMSAAFIYKDTLLNLFPSKQKQRFMDIGLQISPTTSPVVEAATTLTPQNTENWELYSNTEYGFKFLYPMGYKVEERDPGFIVLTTEGENVPQAGISFDARLNPPYDSFTDADRFIKESLDVSTETGLNNWNIYQGVGKESMVKGIEFLDAITPYKDGVLKAGTIYVSPYKDIFNEVLKSFSLL